MKTKRSDLVEKLTVRVNAEVVNAIQKSGQSAPDWLRQAARNRIDGERQAETPTGKLRSSSCAPWSRLCGFGDRLKLLPAPKSMRTGEVRLWIPLVVLMVILAFAGWQYRAVIMATLAS